MTPAAVARPTLTLEPGGLGPLKLGMSKAEAAATRLVAADVPSTVCQGTIALQPRAPYTSSFDVRVDQAGRVSDIGVQDPGLATSEGIHIGSTLADVQRAYPGSGSPGDPGGDAAPYHQSAIFVQHGNDHLGFLFQARPGQAKPTDTVTFMEIRRGQRPGLFRDGC